MPDQPQPFLSVVVPAFEEESNILVLYEELMGVFDALAIRWEILFIDDGSMDDTWQAIRKIHDRDKRVRGYRLSRNFGHQHAIVAGLSYARGQAVITMDADLQHPPKTIPLLLDEWRTGAKVVNTIRIDNDIPWNKKIASRLFYKVFSFPQQ